jgi:peptidoglycan/LPS O-acetylase OafA/YrhL
MRKQSLDLLRFIAIFMVLCRHMTPDCPNPIINAVMKAGWAGVDLFFVLSGFLVSGLLFQEYFHKGLINYKRFFIRRGLKIYPSFMTSVIVYGFFEYFWGVPFKLINLIGEVFFLQNYLSSIWYHTWSLAVEEHFYLFIGIFIYYFSKNDLEKRIIFLCYFVLLGCFFLRSLIFFLKGGINNFATHNRIDSLMFGVLLSYLYHKDSNGLKKMLFDNYFFLSISFFPIFFLFFFPFGHFFWQTIGYSFLYLSFGVFLLFFLFNEKKIANNLLLRFFAQIGASSYPIYLSHVFIKRTLSFMRKKDYLIFSWSGEIFLFFILSILVGIILAYLVEKPILYVRDKYFPSRSGMLK